jgi:hypothetical protein
MSKNRGKSKLSKTVLFNANKHVFHCEKSLGTFFYGQPSYMVKGVCRNESASSMRNVLNTDTEGKQVASLPRQHGRLMENFGYI